MSTISGTGASAWSPMSSTRPMRPPGGMDPSKMKEALFAKVDADGSGKVDKTELQGMLDATVNKSGSTAASAEDMFSTLDADGDGSLNADELDAGMKSLVPPPADTVAFAQSRGGSEPLQGPHPPGGPPAEGPPPGSQTSASATEGSDPLDTNGDGTVSAQEQAAGELATAMGQLFDAVDSDGDNTVSASERDTFLQMLDVAAGQATQATSAATADGSSGTSQDPSQRSPFDLAEFANLVLRQYAQASAGSAVDGVGSTLSVAA